MSRAVRALVAVLLALGAGAVLVVGVASPAAACSCAVFTEARTAQDAQVAYDRSDVVFVGRQTDRQDTPVAPDGTMSSGDPATLTFAVQAVYKGSASAVQRLTTPRRSSSCGLELVGEGPFLVFAERISGRLVTSMCSGSTPRTELAVWPGSPPEGAVVPPSTSPSVAAGPSTSPTLAVVQQGRYDLTDEEEAARESRRRTSLAVLGAGVVALVVGVPAGLLALRRRRRARS